MEQNLFTVLSAKVSFLMAELRAVFGSGQSTPANAPETPISLAGEWRPKTPPDSAVIELTTVSSTGQPQHRHILRRASSLITPSSRSS